MPNRRHALKFTLILCLFACSPGWSYAQAEDPILRMKLLLLDDRFEEVLQMTDTMEVADSLAGRAAYYRGKAYQSMLIYDSAYQCYHRANQLDSSSLSFRVSLGTILYLTGRIREAIEVYEGILSAFQPTDQHLAELANLYAIRKNYAESLSIYKGLLEKDSMNYYYAKQAGKNYVELNQMDSALHYYEQAFSLNPRDVFIAHRLGNLYLLREDYITAIQRVTTGLTYDSSNVDLLKLRGYVFLHFGQYMYAINDLKKAWLQDSLSKFTNKYLGMSYHEEKQFHEAREMLMRAFTLDSTDAETAYFLGNACRWSQFEEEAVGFFQKAIELRLPDPGKMKDVYVQLAELLKVLHRFDEAFEAYDKILEYDPADHTTYFKIAQVYDRNLDQKRKALEYYEKFLSQGSTDQQLPDAGEGSVTVLEEHARYRINRIKEALFFENPEP
jgi:tetratricopeptide (TPR) repeat protein